MEEIALVPETKNKTLPTPTALLHEAWGIYKRIFKTLIGLAFGPLILGIGVGFVSALVYILFLAVVYASHNAILITTFIELGIILGILFIATIGFWFQGATLYAIAFIDENIGIKESLKRSWSKILSIAWIGILHILVV